ncbi:PhoPQ-activated protein PqaA family protein [Kosakonia sp. H02]|nr:PhoPQ-activated protein PqaA family protein [Kosakonia sp. H02]
MKIKAYSLAMLSIPSACMALSPEEKSHRPDLSHVISDYRKSLASMPLDYSLLEKKQLPGVMLQRYTLNSQTWSPQGVVTPERWQNQVDIYIPDSARQKYALVAINNGSNDNGSGSPLAPTSFKEEALTRIATATRTVVISVSNVPNQVLHYQGVTTPLAEDDSVAYTWKLFIGDIKRYQDAPLQVPMSASVSQAFRLAKRELAQQKISKFIVTGASKRGWTAWLTAIADPDVEAIVPFVMDLLNTRKALEHMYRTYGQNWPIAFFPYYKQNIDQQIATDKVASLMRLLDPLAYLHSDLSNRLRMEKYIINASGDDFYVPDNSRFYYGRLPGEKSLRVVANSTHNSVLSVSEQSLITFVNRFQMRKKLPEITENVEGRNGGKKMLSVRFSEKPTTLLQWTATNPVARDFRFACNVKYTSAPVRPASGNKALNIPLSTPESGWQATYVEATFSDGYVATTQVYITPDEKYPETAPPALGDACQTLPGRGLNSVAQ